MNHLNKTVLAAGLLFCLTTPAALAGGGTTCAPGATENMDITATTPTAAFTDNGDGTITDSRTGLMWKQCSQGQSGAGCATGMATIFKWDAALAQAGVANAASFAGHTDWRLPNAKELASIVEQRCANLAINKAVFPNTPSGNFWSSSPYASNADFAWYVGFNFGFVVANFKDFDNRVRLVRAGQ